MKPNRLESILETVGSERRIRYGLEGIKAALNSTGNPERNVHTLVIGGTNGKGGSALLITSALVHAGHKVATFLSPHLQHVSERFLWNLESAPSEQLDEIAASLEIYISRFELTYFEFLTLVFFHWAKNLGAEFLVLEVGLGGRLDATNVTRPIACAITNIALDHQAYLGSTREAILHEKLGILRPESLLFTDIAEPELTAIVESRCLELDAIYYYSRELGVEIIERTWDGQRIAVNGYPLELTNPSAGTTRNAALAFLLLRIVFPKIPVETLRRAFAVVRTPGRLETVHERPRIVLSGDHNPAGIQSLKETLKGLPTGRMHTICGFSPDKPGDEMFAALEALSSSIERVPIREGAAKGAIERALKRAAPEDIILVTGSLYLVGEARPLWRSRPEFAIRP